MTYLERFNSPFAKHLDFSIRQFYHQKEFPAFFCYTEELILLTEKIYKQYEKFLGMINSVPPIILEQFALYCIVDEVQSSNAIEGVRSSKKELSDIVQDISDSPRFYGLVKKYEALRFSKIFQFKTCEDIRNFYDDFAHNEISANNKLDGKLFRKYSVNVTSSAGKILHRGIYTEEKIIDAMNYALQFLNAENIPFLIKVSVFHYLFGYIHPFYDGNGRTSRFIASYFLAEHFHYLPALRFSLIIKRQRNKYYDLFSKTTAEINCGDLTPFITGFIEIISDVFTDIEEILNRKMLQLLRCEKILKSRMPNDELTQKIYSILLQTSMFFGQGISMDGLINLTGKSRNTIKSRLESVSNGYIVVTVNKKNFYKLNLSILKIQDK